MDTNLAVASALGALALGAMSPGPSFILVARIAVTKSRADGLAAALGMGVGAVLFAGLAMVGLQTLLAAAPQLYVWLKVLGGIYLLSLALRMWRAAGETLVFNDDASSQRGARTAAFAQGFFTQVSNPKTTVVYGSIFAALLPQDLPLSIMAWMPLLVFSVEGGWYALVAVGLSSALARDTYLRSKRGVDRLAGGVMGVLGIRLIASADS